MSPRLTIWTLVIMAAALLILPATAQVVGEREEIAGVRFEDFAGPSPDTANFHTADGQLTFFFVTHNAGHPFFIPMFVAAEAAARTLGVNVIITGPERGVDDPDRQLEILQQVITDPRLDGLVLSTAKVGAYGDIIMRAFELGVPVATTNSVDSTIPFRDEISHTGQSAGAAAIGGRALVQCLIDKGITSGVILFPNSIEVNNIEVNNRVRFGAAAAQEALDAAGLAGITVAAGDEGIGLAITGVPGQPQIDAITNLVNSTPNVVGLFGPNGGITPANGHVARNLGISDSTCVYGYDLGDDQLNLIGDGSLDGSLGQQPFLQGWWPVTTLFLQIDRGVSAADLDTKAQLVTQANLEETLQNNATRRTN
ncbi:MAG: substrate-binding domain-containing protein [Deinococcus sp.]|nr:substrate-binding domain-containing protein [Deinococcus sp.]